jgi:hypothetical protein
MRTLGWRLINRLDLFRTHLQAADIDDAAPAAGEREALTRPFDHVAGVDETCGINERLSTDIPFAAPHRRRGAWRVGKRRAETVRRPAPSSARAAIAKACGKPARPSLTSNSSTA